MILRRKIKLFNANNLTREFLLTTRKTTTLRNTFEYNTSTDIKLSRTQISKISQSFLISLLSKLAGPLMKVAIVLAKKTS